MEKDQLLRWAVKAGAWPEMSNTPEKDIAFLERFAALVAAHEREQCALVVEGQMVDYSDYIIQQENEALQDAASAIRARGEGVKA